MSEPYTKCQYIDYETNIECENWYAYEEGQKLCPTHRDLTKIAAKESLISIRNREANRIPRTVSVISSTDLQKLNAEMSYFLKLSIPEIEAHVREIEVKLQDLERSRRAANIARRTLLDRLTEDERTELRAKEVGKSYLKDSPKKSHAKKAKSPEEKAENRTGGFSKWAARLGLKVDELMIMDDDEMAARIAKYKASHDKTGS